MQSLRNGTQLGAYTLIQLMARGGMGEVYEAHEVNLQRRVALKVIAPTNPDEHDRDQCEDDEDDFLGHEGGSRGKDGAGGAAVIDY